ncbi:MAG: alanine/ornithine racemase family PLP-dependent enzyme [Bacillota bacterium]
MTTYPALYIDVKKIQHNAHVVAGLLGGQGMRLVGVAKGAMGHPAVAKAMVDGGASAIGDSRVENLRRLRSLGYEGETVLLRAPSLTRVAEAVQVADVSLNSDPLTVKALGDAAARLGKRHRVILMVDLGDLREGVMVADAPDVAEEMSRVAGIELCGIGTNLACYGGVIPTREKMESLLAVKKEIETVLRRPLERVSGGNSANMRLLLAGDTPHGITELRIGESILLGTEAIERRAVPGCYPDAFTIAAEVIEVVQKPSAPFGEVGQNAFGVVPTFVDRGRRRRAILAIGRQDVDPDSLVPIEDGVTVVGASSDHLICDVEDARWPVRAGAVLTFIPGYSALLRASTSPFVEKVVQ